MNKIIRNVKINHMKYAKPAASHIYSTSRALFVLVLLLLDGNHLIILILHSLLQHLIRDCSA